MGKKKKVYKPKRVQIVLEVEEKPTRCCECMFGETCPFACELTYKLDCAKYDLSNIEVKEIREVSHE